MKSELHLQRINLEKLHTILSTISFENSQTMSYIQSSSKMPLQEYRKPYFENCQRLHEALAISEIHFPEMRESINTVYGRSNVFWGRQEGILRTNVR